MSKPPAVGALRPRGGAGSARASSAGGDGAEGQQVVKLDFAEVGLDVLGSDDMLKELWVMIKNQKVEQRPDGRRCSTCPFRDSTWCPLSIARRRVKTHIKWGNGPLSDGKTQGRHCWACVTYVRTHVTKSSITPVTVGLYEVQLAADTTGQLLEQHSMVIMMAMKGMIESNASNWLSAEREAGEIILKFSHTNKLRKRRPMAQNYSVADYEEKCHVMSTSVYKVV